MIEIVHLEIVHARKIFPKMNISYLLMCVRALRISE